MTVALIATSHSPLLEYADLDAGVAAELDQAFTTARRFAEDFDPELVISFGPDHYNGFFYNLMPPFCIGYAASSVGDYGTQAGALNVPAEIAQGIAEAVMSAGIDLAVSLHMELDHGGVQPMEILFGDITGRPMVPIFLNSVAPPFTPIQRVRLLGEAVGRHVAQLDMRTLLIASGGLSHDPPVPRLATATPDQRRILLGQHLPVTPDARKAREQRVIDTAKAFATGTADIQDLAPDWDRTLMDTLASGDVTSLDAWTPEEMAKIAGNSSHEVRSWIAAYAALGACGTYSVQYSYYRPIRELIAGFGLTTVTLD
jgi:2,3-dihydroxyphenylpropionate 1,2-dioxygenase